MAVLEGVPKCMPIAKGVSIFLFIQVHFLSPIINASAWTIHTTTRWHISESMTSYLSALIELHSIYRSMAFQRESLQMLRLFFTCDSRHTSIPYVYLKFFFVPPSPMPLNELSIQFETHFYPIYLKFFLVPPSPMPSNEWTIHNNCMVAYVRPGSMTGAIRARQ